MTDEEEEQILAKAQAEMITHIRKFVGKPFTAQTLAEIEYVLEQGRRRLKSVYGVKLPKIVAVILPSLGFVHFTRSDRTQDQVERLIIDFARSFPLVDKQELAVAIARAFPWYRPKRKPAIEIIEDKNK